MPLVVHFRRPAGWQVGIRIHYWDTASADPATTWPGLPMMAEANDWFVYTFPTATAASIVFHDGAGRQTGNLRREADGWYYTNNTWYALNPERPAIPVIRTSPAARLYDAPQTVTLESSNDDDAIWYTTDGSEPWDRAANVAAPAAQRYRQPFTVTVTTTILAVGGYVGVEALLQIAEFVGKDPAFADQAGLEAYMRQVNTGYGPLTDAQWAQLARHASRQDEAGLWRQHYDPKLAEPFRQGFSEPVTLWPLWDLIATPTLILRGTESQILTAETAAEMVSRKPGTRLVEFPGVGHAPMLMALDQITALRNWLLEA